MKKLIILAMMIGSLISSIAYSQDMRNPFIPSRALYLCDAEIGKVYYDELPKAASHPSRFDFDDNGKNITIIYYQPNMIEPEFVGPWYSGGSIVHTPADQKMKEEWGDKSMYIVHDSIRMGIHIALNSTGMERFMSRVPGSSASVPGQKLAILLQIDCKGRYYHIDTLPFGFRGWKEIPSGTWIETASETACKSYIPSRVVTPAEWDEILKDVNKRSNTNNRSKRK